MLYVIGLSGLAVMTLWVYALACAVQEEWRAGRFDSR